MANIFGKLGDMIFGEDDDNFEEFEEKEQEKKTLRPERRVEKNDRVVNIHATTQLEVAVLQPHSYEDAREIADRLKSKRAVVINLESLDHEEAKKVLDFVSGVVYALEGDIQKVSGGIFLIAPYNVTIAGDVKDELRKGIFPFGF